MTNLRDKMTFEHRAMELEEENKIVFIAMSKRTSYFKRHAVKYVLENGFTPISQFGIFDYFLLDTVDRDVIRQANNNLIKRSDEMWVFGPISDGVLAEIKMCKGDGRPVKYFKIIDSKEVEEVPKEEVEFEEEVEEYKDGI